MPRIPNPPDNSAWSAAITENVRRLARRHMQVAVVGGGGGSAAESAVAHNILSTTHTDSLAASVSAGDIIRGNATPKWSRLAIGNTSDVLTVTGGLPVWQPLSSTLTTTILRDAGIFRVKPNPDVCGIVGGLFSRVDGITNKSTTPFCSSGTTQVGRTEAWVMPTPCWLFNTRITQSATETTQSLGHVGLEKNGNNSSGNGLQNWAVNLLPLSAGPATYGGGEELVFFEVGSTLKCQGRLNGAGTTVFNPHWSACAYPTSSNRIPLGFWTTNLGAGTTAYGCYGDSGTETTAVNAALVHPAGTLKRMFLRTASGQGAGFNTTITIQKNGSDTGLTITIPAATAADSTFSVTADATFNGTTDYFNTKIVAAAGAGNSAVGICSLEFEPTTVGSAPLPFFLGRAIGTTQYYLAPFDYWNTTATEVNAIFPMPRGGTVSAANCYAYLTTGLTAGHTATLILRKNGSDTAIRWDITSSTPTGPVAASGANVTLVDGDYITLSQTGSGGSGWISAVNILVV